MKRSKDHIYGLGVEGNVFVPSIRTQFALRWHIYCLLLTA